eukprot:TRINITY_DN5367_c0_g1_i1.p1 TRINITY_DN5367_c0_g1~~TRINITY_DN5367_c0_g1_i1.p1  ORF type:complete len:837 (-),score=236.76 TRINITY_DN5367_c0_g1_i1:20-2530(-)
MEKAIPFIQFNKGAWSINPEGAQVLRGVTGKVAVIAVAGMYRTGKSYVLNRLMGKQHGFDIGPSIQPCTRGIWIWGKPLDHQLPSGERISVILLDTEGLGSLQESETHDVRVFSLALLLSSLFIYNSMGTIDDTAVERLNLVAQLTQHIHVKSQPRGSAAALQASEATQLAEFFPGFIWLVRDFALALQDEDGHHITSAEYLESALRPRPGKGTVVAEKNAVRSKLRSLFRERDCVTLVRPVENEKDLQSLAKLPYDRLRREFRDQMEAFVQRVFVGVHPKTMFGHTINGPALLNLAEQYVRAINEGAAPVITSAWSSTVALAAETAIKAGLAIYQSFIAQAEAKFPLAESDLAHAHSQAVNAANDAFTEHAIGTSDEQRKGMMATILQQYAVLQQRNHAASASACDTLLQQLYAPIAQKVLAHGYPSLGAFDGERREMQRAYEARAPGVEKATRLCAFLNDTVFADAMRVSDAIARASAEAAAQCQQQVMAAQRQQLELQQRHQAELTQLTQSVSAAQAEKSALQRTIATQEEQLRSLQRVSEERDRQNSQGLTELTQARQQVNTLQQERAALSQQLQNATATSQQEMQRTSIAGDFARKRVTELETTLSQVAETQQGFMKQLDAERARNHALDTELLSTRPKITALQQEVQRQQEFIDMLQHQLTAMQRVPTTTAAPFGGAGAVPTTAFATTTSTAGSLPPLHPAKPTAATTAPAAKSRKTKTSVSKRSRTESDQDDDVRMSGAASDTADEADWDEPVSQTPRRKSSMSRTSFTPAASHADAMAASDETVTLAEIQGMTVNQIKSLLTKHNVDLPAQAQKKPFYVELAKKTLKL